MSKVDSKKVAIALVEKLIKYEKEVNKKQIKTEAEKRHLALLRGLRRL